LDSVYAGIDSAFVYGRLDFAGPVPDMEFDVVVNLESWANGEARARRSLRLDAKVRDKKLASWKVDGREEPPSPAAKATPQNATEDTAKAALLRNFEFRLPLSWLLAAPSSPEGHATSPDPTTKATNKTRPTAGAIEPTSRLRLRFSLWHNRLPVDALPMEGWIELQLVSEWELGAV
jgi:hypothetical protein